MPIVVLTAGVAGSAIFSGDMSPDGLAAANRGSGSKINGNISIDSGERIYHVPEQKFYSQTRIAPEWGERWFCSEADARKAGWRKAKR